MKRISSCVLRGDPHSIRVFFLKYGNVPLFPFGLLVLRRSNFPTRCPDAQRYELRPPINSRALNLRFSEAEDSLFVESVTRTQSFVILTKLHIVPAQLFIARIFPKIGFHDKKWNFLCREKITIELRKEKILTRYDTYIPFELKIVFRTIRKMFWQFFSAPF